MYHEIATASRSKVYDLIAHHQIDPVVPRASVDDIVSGNNDLVIASASQNNVAATKVLNVVISPQRVYDVISSSSTKGIVAPGTQ